VVAGRNTERGNEVVECLESRGCDAIFVATDLEDPANINALLSTARERYGVIHHLANCAGITDRGDVWDRSVDLFDRMMNVNLRSAFLTCQGVARMARDEGVPASIVNVGSVAAYGGAPFITAYSISKGAMMTMTRWLAHQLMQHRITVVMVNPGWMDTPGEDDTQRRYHDAVDDWLNRVEAKQPFGRLIKPEEIARTLAFVLSDDAGMVTGTVIDYDQSLLGAGEGQTAPPRG
jgi:NAD(P)-dependent dehydrogenase (short-subunit alcohol dehydrogenase family)